MATLGESLGSIGIAGQLTIDNAFDSFKVKMLSQGFRVPIIGRRRVDPINYQLAQLGKRLSC